MLPLRTFLGQLEIVEVYEYLDGPRLFAARNNIGTMYLVYWFDEEDDATGWLYLPISEAKLSRLRRRAMTLNAAFREPETVYYLVYTGVPPREDTAKLVTRGEIDTEFFPPDGYYIEYVHVLNEQTDGWSFETSLKGGMPSADVVSQFIGRLSELVENVMENFTDGNVRLYPQSALPGSIRIKFSADSHSDAIRSLRIIEQLVESNDEGEFRHQLRELKVDPSQLKDFLTSISSNQLDVEITPKLASDGETIKLLSEHVDRCIEYLADVNYIVIDSIKIPQANDIDKVLVVVNMINDGTPLTPANIGGLTAERQVKYYTDAAYALGLTNREKQLTAAGHFIISQAERVDQYQILADRFESTDFGWGWMKWAGVKYMTELDPKSAAAFIIASVPALSQVTARRRASTLEQWLIKLKPYHRRYVSE